MLPNYNKMSSNNDNANNNSNNNIIAQQSKNMLSAILPERVPSALSITAVGNNVEGRNTKITPTNSDDCPREGILDSTPNHNNGGTTTTSNNISYQSIRYAHLLTPSTNTNTATATTMANYTTLTSRHRTGRRCYRLNLERPFNIHCEQSPLEYGDIFAPWDKSVRPVTKGPSEYCPPRHLGGGEEIWRRLVSFGRYGNDTLNNGNGPITNNKGDVNGESNNGGTKKGGMEGGMNLGWRKLTPHEVTSVERLGELNPQGEYSFSTYDLTHVKPRMKKQQLQQQQSGGGGGGDQQGGDKEGGTKQEGDNFREITPSTSIDSTSSDSDSNNPKSALLKANETARLFRRSELSLRLKAEEEAQKHAAQVAQRNAERNEREQAELNELKKIKGAKGISRRMSKRASLNGKKMLRKLSSSFGATSTTSSGSSTKMMNYNGGIYEGGMGPHSSSRRRLVSTQAGMIEKAKDVIDEESEDEYDGEKYDDTKKIKNMSLFIVGEYDVLNDLCLDGGKRLKASQNLSDLDLLLQNDPCPPPNRWVRKTGWGKCNPSSMYAECPPKDFDWEKYLKKDGPVPVNPVPRPVMQVKS